MQIIDWLKYRFTKSSYLSDKAVNIHPSKGLKPSQIATAQQSVIDWVTHLFDFVLDVWCAPYLVPITDVFQSLTLCSRPAIASFSHRA